MKLSQVKAAIQVQVRYRTATPLLLCSGDRGEYTDATLQTTPDGLLHVNGHVWSGLLRRCLLRIKNGKKWASLVGDYSPENCEGGVSPFWFESTSAAMPGYDVIAANRIDREYGVVTSTGLFNFELAPAGLELPMKFVVFISPEENVGAVSKMLQQALWVTGTGVESIGGGWGYGYGKLEFLDAHQRFLNLTKKEDRAELWSMNESHMKPLMPEKADIAVTWARLRAKAKILDGQLLCIADTDLPFWAETPGSAKEPDHYMHRQTVIQNGQPLAMPVITGKAVRQALLSMPMERAWRTGMEQVCNPGYPSSESCTCKRCTWFGNTHHRGMVSVADCVVDPQSSNLEVLHRIKLCEHTRQISGGALFADEYLTSGHFTLDIVVDSATRPETFSDVLAGVRSRCESMCAGNAPPGWDRLGKTSASTGQIEILSIDEEIFGHAE